MIEDIMNKNKNLLSDADAKKPCPISSEKTQDLIKTETTIPAKENKLKIESLEPDEDETKASFLKEDPLGEELSSDYLSAGRNLAMTDDYHSRNKPRWKRH